MKPSKYIKLFEVFESKVPNHSLNIVTEYADDGDLSEKIKIVISPNHKFLIILPKFV